LGKGNYPNLNSNGIEFSSRIKPREIAGNNFFIENITIAYVFVKYQTDSNENKSYYVLANLKHKLSLGITHAIYKNFRATWNLSYQERNGAYDNFSIDPLHPVETKYTPFYLLDGRIFYQTKWLKIFAEASNILNANYVDLGNIAQPGRWFKAGIEVNVGWGNSGSGK
jgi:iron complex outermembrane receptor protein